jgi:serine/threonine protein kinase
MIDSPFIVNLVGFSQDEAHIYLLMDYVSGYDATTFFPSS